jgi:hypothetical protein
MRQCQACGRKFASRKTARKHKCKDSKVVRAPPAAAVGQVSHPVPRANVDKPRAPITAALPTAPARPPKASASHSNTIPAVTGDSRETAHVKIVKAEPPPSPGLPPLPPSPEVTVLAIERTDSRGKRTRTPSPDWTTLFTKKLRAEE